jgi:hypothetical protein
MSHTFFGHGETDYPTPVRWDARGNGALASSFKMMKSKEYRYLVKNEILQPGDEFYCKNYQEWHAFVASDWKGTGVVARVSEREANDKVIRRPVGVEQAGKCQTPPAGWACTRDAGHAGPCAAIPITEISGYRLLKRGETIVEGDEIFMTGPRRWERTVMAGCNVVDGILRRKIQPPNPPGDGYRFLDVDEILQSGDQFRDSYNEWIDCSEIASGAKVRIPNLFRRKVEPSPAKPALFDGFKDISNEKSRTYGFPNGQKVVIEEPAQIHISKSGHRIVTKLGTSIYVPMGWLAVAWTSHDTSKPFLF